MTDTSQRPAPAAPPSAVALTPAQTEAKAEEAALAKAAMPAGRCFVLAMLAGAFIGFGAAFFGMVMSDSSLTFAASRVLGGLCFSLGLLLVLCCGAELFTGNSLMVCAAASGRVRAGALARNWGIVWVGNLAGSVVLAGLMLMANLQGMNAGAVGDSFVSIAAGKASLPWEQVLGKGILCNMLVCLAVWIGFASKTVADKALGILLPITGFVAMGFEHCVANMFFFTMGLGCKAAGFGAGVAGAGALTLGGACYNLVLATIGNVIGGAVLIGLAYWLAYRKPEAAK